MSQTVEIKLVLDADTRRELQELNREIIREEIESAFGNFRSQQDENYSMSIKDVAQTLKVSEITIRRWFKNGDLKGKRIGGIIRFKPNEIEKALSSVDKLLYKRTKSF